MLRSFSGVILLIALFAACKSKTSPAIKNCSAYQAGYFRVTRQYTMPVKEEKIFTILRNNFQEEWTDVKTGEKTVYEVSWEDSCRFRLGTVINEGLPVKTDPITRVVRMDGPRCEIIATTGDYHVLSQRYAGNQKPLIDTLWRVK